AHAMQAAGNLVAIVVELTTSMQHGHDDLCRGNAFFLVHIHRDTAAVVANGDRLIGVNGDADIGAVAGQCLIDGVVHHFEHHAVKAGAVIGVADVHARALAYGIQTFEYLDTRGVVRVVLVAHAFTPDAVITPCSTWNMATGVSVRQPSFKYSWSTQVMNTWHCKSSSRRHRACRCRSSSSDGKSSTR